MQYAICAKYSGEHPDSGNACKSSLLTRFIYIHILLYWNRDSLSFETFFETFKN